MTEPTVIALGDNRNTTHTVQTIDVSTGQCCAEHGSCGKPGVIAVRNTLAQERPTEISTLRVTLCAEHRTEAPRMHSLWVAAARELQDPVKNAEFLAAAGITN